MDLRDLNRMELLGAIEDASKTLLSADEAKVRLVGAALLGWIEGGAEIGLDTALGLRERGGISAQKALALSGRDRILHRLYRTHNAWNELAPTAAARLISLAATRYEAGRWPRERAQPLEPTTEPARSFWQILQSGELIPKARQLQEILKKAVQ